MRKFYLIVLLILSLLPFYKINAQTNAGFVPGNIWYSKDPFEEGDKIKIYTVLFNPNTREFSGTVIFFDKTTFLGKKDFTIPTKGVEDLSIDWTVTVGDHTIFAKIENAKFLISAGKYEEIYLIGNQTEENSRSVAKKIIQKTNTTNNTSTTGLLDAGSQSIENLGKLIEEKTPSLVSKPIIASTNGIENLRQKIATLSANSKEETKKELESMKTSTVDKKPTNTKNSKDAQTQKTDTNKLLKPFKYVELFFFSVISFVFNNKFIFYGLSLVIVFFILRYIWRLFF